MRTARHAPIPRWAAIAVLAAFLATALLLAFPRRAAGATFTVTKTADTADGACDADCSLREAVVAANAAPGPDTITLPAGVYLLTIPFGGFVPPATAGDLHITDDLTINGAGQATTIIDGNGLDHVLRVAGASLPTVAINAVTIRGGNTTTNGGGIFNGGGTFTLTDTTVSGNSTVPGSPANGGGIYNDGVLTLVNSTVFGNSAPDGGGIWNSGSLTLTNSTVVGNPASRGGGIWNSGSLTLTNSTVSGNTASRGGGINNDPGGTVELTNSTVSGNFAFCGGGIYNDGALTLVSSTVDRNTADSNGGGIDNGAGGTVELTNSTVSGNTASDFGGGISNDSSLTILNSTVSGNTVDSAGGGIWNTDSATLTNSTISGNMARDGGGTANDIGATLTIVNSTITANTASGLGGGMLNEGPATLKNAIVASNAPADCSGGPSSLGHNLDSDDTCNLGNPDDLPGVDPLLGPLANNGGPTQTHALLPGSPAINAGDDSVASATDQRGLLRVGTVDIGASEFQGAVGVDDDGDGFDSVDSGGTDCDDTDANIFPGAPEIADDGIDQDCDGSYLMAETDEDGDGFDSIADGGTDCNDTDATVFPGAPKIADDGIDQDCDGSDLLGEADDEMMPEAEQPPAGELMLRDGGQFVFWQFATALVADVFGSVKIVWLWDPFGRNWTSFIPLLGTVNFALAPGDFLWVVSVGAQTIAVG